jgi:hypothetical protein
VCVGGAGGVHEALFLWRFSSFKASMVGNDGSTAHFFFFTLILRKKTSNTILESIKTTINTLTSKGGGTPQMRYVAT